MIDDGWILILIIYRKDIIERCHDNIRIKSAELNQCETEFQTIIPQRMECDNKLRQIDGRLSQLAAVMFKISILYWLSWCWLNYWLGCGLSC